MVANNFDCLKGWESWTDLKAATRTWKRLNEYVIPASELSRDKFWFTNYCQGVKDNRNKQDPKKGDPCYKFDTTERRALEFERIFAEFVAAMQPKVIVALGGDVKDYLSYLNVPRDDTILSKDLFGCSTKIMSGVHPSARYQSIETFRELGRRIHRAYHA